MESGATAPLIGALVGFFLILCFAPACRRYFKKRSADQGLMARLPVLARWLLLYFAVLLAMATVLRERMGSDSFVLALAAVFVFPLCKAYYRATQVWHGARV